MPAKNVRITGCVQGVFFRAHAKEKADQLGVTGWVKNESDGSVSIHAEGSEDQLQELEEWCRHGPPGADVERIERRDAPEEGHHDFSIM